MPYQRRSQQQACEDLADDTRLAEAAKHGMHVARSTHHHDELQQSNEQ
jgi:hypothetical protein